MPAEYLIALMAFMAWEHLAGYPVAGVMQWWVDRKIRIALSRWIDQEAYSAGQSLRWRKEIELEQRMLERQVRIGQAEIEARARRVVEEYRSRKAFPNVSVYDLELSRLRAHQLYTGNHWRYPVKTEEQ